MKSVSRYPDNHTLYVTSGASNNEDLVKSVSQALRAYEKTKEREYSCNVTANLVFDKEGVPLGFGYLYISNTQVYNMLLGKNPDGSERTKLVEKEGKRIFSPDDGVEWVEDWSQDKRELVTEQLPKLLNPEIHIYTPKQKQNFQKLITRIKKSEKQHLPPEYFHPDKCSFVFEKAYVKPVGEQYSLNVLCGRKIPVWLNAENIYSIFRKFISDKKVKKKVRIKGRFAEVPYPVVTINRKKALCFIEFNPLSRDAQFALLMTTRVVFRNKRNPSQSSLITFVHSFKNKKR